jgi:hypothetical protein
VQSKTTSCAIQDHKLCNTIPQAVQSSLDCVGPTSCAIQAACGTSCAIQAHKLPSPQIAAIQANLPSQLTSVIMPPHFDSSGSIVSPHTAGCQPFTSCCSHCCAQQRNRAPALPMPCCCCCRGGCHTLLPGAAASQRCRSTGISWATAQRMLPLQLTSEEWKTSFTVLQALVTASQRCQPFTSCCIHCCA